MEPWILRAVHVLAAALVVGVSTTMALGRFDGRRAEWLFWPAVALLVLGGLSNLGALGNVPAHGTPWGRLLVLKLVLLLALLGVSAARLGRTIAGAAAPRLWTASALLSASALVTAVVLAHG